jgi:hypothetical protein
MSKDDEEDPMEYLNKMRAQMESMKVNQAAQEEAHNDALVAASNAKESMDRIENLLTPRDTDGSDHRAKNQPPAGLSPEEEQEWWTNRIAFLSKPVSETYDDPSSSSADSKESSDTLRGAKKSNKESDDGSRASSKASRK